MLTIALRGLVIAASSAAVTLAQLGLPSDQYWAERTSLLYLATAAFSVVAFYEVSRAALVSLQAESVRAYERDVRAHLSEALVEVGSKFSTADLKQIGVHAFRVRGMWVFARLVNIGGLRLGKGPSMYRPRWRRGKGVVGRAWADGKTVAVDWSEVYTRANAQGPAKWRSLQARQRFGLSWGELQLTRRYERIVATPMYAPRTGRLIGCVAIDCPLPLVDVRSTAMDGVVTEVGRRVAELGRPPRAWWGRT